MRRRGEVGEELNVDRVFPIRRSFLRPLGFQGIEDNCPRNDFRMHEQTKFYINRMKTQKLLDFYSCPLVPSRENDRFPLLVFASWTNVFCFCFCKPYSWTTYLKNRETRFSLIRDLQPVFLRNDGRSSLLSVDQSTNGLCPFKIISVSYVQGNVI